MLLIIVGLTCVTSVFCHIPPWGPCPQQTFIPNACVFGNLTVSLTSKTLYPKDCNQQIEISEFKHTPVIHINTTNTTEHFTVVVVDLGPEGRGPSHLQWMVTNVTKQSLPNFMAIPGRNVLQNYNPPLMMEGVVHRTLVQILVFRHHNVLRIPFGEVWTKVIRNFSLSTLFSNTNPNIRLCGPVAGTQYWVYDRTYAPSAPPLPPHGQPVPPGYVPVVPVVPVGQAPVPGVPGAPTHHHPAHTTFAKRSSATLSQPMEILFIPLVILTVMWL